MKSFFILFAFVALSSTQISAQEKKQTYIESKEDFPNPERGFYRPTEAKASHYVPLTSSQLQAIRLPYTLKGARYTLASTLLYRGFLLDSFVHAPIAEWYLQKMQQDFALIREAGMKVIVRFAYTNTAKSGDCGDAYKICPPYGDAPKEIVLLHIEQLKPILQQNADVIAVLQMGFIGIWGENYFTDYFGDASTNKLGRVMDSSWNDRHEVLKKLLDAVPASRMVQVRTPQIKQRFVYGAQATIEAAPLSESEAFSGADKARVGLHNDCFLASADDYGTFYDYGNSTSKRDSANEVLRAYFKEDSRYVAVGGETCDNTFSPQNDCAPAGYAETEMRAMHYSYLNASYNMDVVNDWEKGGCMENIKRNLGYRFVLREASMPSKATKGKTVSFTIQLENQGYASPFNQRPAQIVLRNKQTGKNYFITTKADVRFWFSGKITWQELFQIPMSLPVGAYAVFINLPDAAASLSAKPAYSIRFANDSVWEARTGFNALHHTITISQ